MYLTRTTTFAASVGVALFALVGTASADTIDPTTFSADLAVGESATVRKTVVVSNTGPTDATIDVHFLIDTSGSMGSQVNAAKAAATNLFNSLNSSFGDVRASVGVFSEGTFLNSSDDRDNVIIGAGGVFPAALASDATTFQTNVNTVTLGQPDFGGDTPESGWDGMKLSAENLAWRPGSNRFMFVFTDAPAKGDLAGAQAAIAANDINVVALSYGSLATITASYATPFGGDAFAATTSADGIIADVTAGITAGFAEYSTVTVDDLGGGLPEIDVSTVCVSADIGACAGSTAVGAYDRSVSRTFEFDVTFTRVAEGDTTFETFALVDGGIVAREIDTFTGGVVPLPAAAWLLLGGLGALGAVSRRKKAA